MATMNKNNINLKFKNMEEVKVYAEANDRVLLVHNDLILDVTTFHAHHPGGGMLVRNHQNKDIKQQLDYHQPLTVTFADTMAIGSFKKDIERLIDPLRPLSPQIWAADQDTYLKLINSPHWMFVESPRMFESDFIEMMSHNKWYMVPIMPCLLIIHHWYSVIPEHTFNILTCLTAAISGLLFFSLFEYILHRFVFHSQSILPDNRLIRYLHFNTHGVHHMLPNDPDRLVLPVPIFIVIYLLVVQPVLKNMVQLQDTILYASFWTCFLIGYMIYDISHYALHNIDTTKHKGSWFHLQQKYHNRHHFSGEDAGFGVSTPLWDVILGTGYKRKIKQ